MMTVSLHVKITYICMAYSFVTVVKFGACNGPLQLRCHVMSNSSVVLI